MAELDLYYYIALYRVIHSTVQPQLQLRVAAWLSLLRQWYSLYVVLLIKVSGL